MFWIIKILTTAMGEALSDFLVHRFDPVVAGLGTAVVFVAVLVAQIRARRLVPWLYWATVVMIGILGTMVADGIHVALGVPYVASVTGFLVVLIAVFVVWKRTEGSLDVHWIDTRRRELYYWAVVVATFALGTATGDLTASKLRLGFLVSGLTFGAAIVIVALLGLWRLLGPVAAFWIAYVLTRPIGASFADWGASSKAHGGLGFGTGPVAGVLAVAIVALVIVASVSDSRARRAARREIGVLAEEPALG
jgi:uncharacterized membrane-anchored protein